MSLPRHLRADHRAIASRVPEGVRVLDVGCGDGALLALLKSEKQVDARGLELSSELAGVALARGLPVVQGDADTDLEVFPDAGFDVAILSKTIQSMRRPARVLQELGRIAPQVIVSFRNYGYWRRRLSLLANGRMPGSRIWHDENVLHPATLRDIVDLCDTLRLDVVASADIHNGRVGEFRQANIAVLNWTADEVILHLEQK
ncbi:MAG: methionine biosynthesis protein MetW [Pseudomonadota bacterium]